jgi:hypothetical protein
MSMYEITRSRLDTENAEATQLGYEVGRADDLQYSFFLVLFPLPSVQLFSTSSLLILHALNSLAAVDALSRYL